MKIQHWNGHNIRFVEVNGEWMAVGKDVTDALGYANSRKALADHVNEQNKNTVTIRYGIRGNPNRIVVDELGIYDLATGSHMPQATQFKNWIHNIVKQLREALNLQSYQAFEMFDTAHQKEAMAKLQRGLKHPDKVNYIKANTIANKAVSNQYGLAKMIRKDDMTPEMLVDRAAYLDDTVQLMQLKDRYGMNISISDTIYSKKHSKDNRTA